MKRDLDSRCFQRESCIPRSSFWPIETASERLGVRERRIHDVGVGEPKHKFPNGDPWQEPGLAQQPLVSRALEFEEGSQHIRICGQSVEATFFSPATGAQSTNAVL